MSSATEQATCVMNAVKVRITASVKNRILVAVGIVVEMENLTRKTMKIECYLSIGLVGCKREETIEVEDELSELDIEEVVREWMYENIEWGWSRNEEN